MRKSHVSRPLSALVAWLVILWIAGGASRADVIAQTFTRGAAWVILILLIILAKKPDWRPLLPLALFLGAAILLVLLQLIPLPPSIWMSLPGRDLLTQPEMAGHQMQPWRPISISPGATRNALSSLIVPLTTLALMAQLRPSDRDRTPAILLALIFASSLLGLLQFSGARFNNPLINDIPGMVSASFANRNHFALFCAIGCVMAPAWGFRDHRDARWKGPAGIALLLFFGLIILATGSRAGLFVGAAGTVIGLLIARRGIAAQLAKLPRRTALLLAGATLGLAVTFVVLSVLQNRAIALDRIASLEPSQDLRRQALPTLVSMLSLYFPVGAGVGTFDPLYRISEPTGLLSMVYFNHAHDDLLEIVLESGIFAIVLLAVAVIWWIWQTAGAWRTRQSGATLARIGSAVLFLFFVASVWDYPARTPMIMAVMVMAAVWLNDAARPGKREPATAE